MTQREGDLSGTERASETLQAELERTRVTMQQDIKSIGEKFTPAAIEEQAKGVLEDMRSEGATMMRETKDKTLGAVRTAGESALESAGGLAHEVGARARHVGEMTADYARRGSDYARRAGTATGDFVTENAIPLSLIGLGVGWLVLSLRKQRAPRYLDELEDEFEYRGHDDLIPAVRARTGEVAGTARELAQQARERVGAVAESARERVGSLAERASQGVDVARTRVTDAAVELGHQATELSHEARERMHRAQVRTRDFADENPLAVGAVAIAAGVGVGLLLPATQPENRLMGETRERLVGDARHLLREVRETGREAARDVRSVVGDPRAAH